MPEPTNQEIIELVLLNRNIQYAYQLQTWTDESLKQFKTVLRKSQKEILTYLNKQGINLTDWSEARSLALLDHFSDLTVAVRSMLGETITQIAMTVGANALLTHNDILSFGGRIEPFNNVSMTADQLRSFVQETPLGGKVLQEWVDSVYDFNIQQQIKNELITGAVQGESYPDLVGRIQEGFSIAEKDAINIARTYVQSANVNAQETVYNDNSDIVTGIKWVATLETSFKKSGRGVCLVCASLDGSVWKLDEKHPTCPRHIRCRCLLIPQTKTWRELGIDMDEMESAYRPYTIRPDINIGKGRKGKSILNQGFIQGNYSDFLSEQSDRFQMNVLGPTRFDLYQKGLGLKDMVDQNTGKLILIKNL